MSPRDERDVMVKFIVDTTEQLTVAGWHPRSVAVAEGCGKDDASYGYDQWAPAGVDPIGDARKVQAYWESLGMSVRMVNESTSPTLFAEGGPVLRADFDTHAVEGNYRVGAITKCRPGDWYELNEQDNADRAAGKLVPGDEGLIIDPGKIPFPSPSVSPAP
ncbi:hypothetical protein [Mycetocola sp. JXN-3]|uniref:hypothetical protein n=1 Tax=Mycetocola sp. JXN-3 TaxID=2116510 RepID=UPI00165D0423|nr:hypothetical protein [Mycetocola sp. JXN-3]